MPCAPPRDRTEAVDVVAFDFATARPELPAASRGARRRRRGWGRSALLLDAARDGVADEETKDEGLQTVALEECRAGRTSLVSLPRALREGDTLTLRGLGFAATCELLAGPEASAEVVLMFSPRKRDGCVARGGRGGDEDLGRASDEETSGGYPFGRDGEGSVGGPGGWATI